MAKRLLDSNKLYPFFRKKRRGSSSPSRDDAAVWARELSALHGTGVIATPVYVEFLCGVTDRNEMDLAVAFLDAFENIDGGRILPEDWQAASDRARRVPASRKPRQVVDCLLFAITQRLNCGLLTDDKDLRRH